MVHYNLDEVVLEFIKNPESISDDEYEFLENSRTQVMACLKELKRDAEIQFAASAARVYEMEARCTEAKRIGREVSVQVDGNRPGSVSLAKVPPEEALSITRARESRWRVKNIKFLNSIEATMGRFKDPESSMGYYNES